MIERATSVALSFGIHFGIMNSNMQNYTDEDLTKRLQELMETPHPQKDAFRASRSRRRARPCRRSKPRTSCGTAGSRSNP